MFNADQLMALFGDEIDVSSSETITAFFESATSPELANFVDDLPKAATSTLIEIIGAPAMLCGYLGITEDEIGSATNEIMSARAAKREPNVEAPILLRVFVRAHLEAHKEINARIPPRKI
jgi:hypothetical protein